MRLRFLALSCLAVGLLGCEPKFSEVTLTGLPTCPNSRLSADLVVKVNGPRASNFQRLDGVRTPTSVKLQQGKTYTVQAYFCKTEPCEVPAQLLSESTITAPEADTGSVAVNLKNLPDCVAVPPPSPPPAAEPVDAGS